MAIAIILVLAFVAIAWLIHEPISGVIGAGFLGKVIAVIAAYKCIGWMIAAFLGPAVRTVHF
jgi:hypothetical protein